MQVSSAGAGGWFEADNVLPPQLRIDHGKQKSAHSCDFEKSHGVGMQKAPESP
jgi:hypothetical protein